MRNRFLMFATLLCALMCALACCKPKQPIIPPTPESTVQGSFDSKFNRYQKGAQFTGEVSTLWADTLWQNDRGYSQIVLWTEELNCTGLTYEVTDLTSDAAVINASAVRLRFGTCVLGDERALGCGEQKARKEIEIADALSETPITILGKSDPVKIWVTVDIPDNTPAGKYKGQIIVKNDGKTEQTFDLEFLVVSHRLPDVVDWSFHLDIWQFPFQILNFCKNGNNSIKPFSDEYFTLVSPFYQLLADTGQKVITTYIKKGAFSDQTMVDWTMTADGHLTFNYAGFDKYVEFMTSIGIDRQISCFSLAGWNRNIQYYDELTQSFRTIAGDTSSEEFAAVWNTFLTDFKRHLDSKGWFDKTVLYMDEIPQTEMQDIISIIKSNCADWKIGLAGSEQTVEIENQLYDYSIFLTRESKTRTPVQTFYTSCSHTFPNNYVTLETSPAEMTWIGFYAAKAGYDGYLRWAYDYWTKTNPLNAQDGTSSSGDNFFVYRAENRYPTTVLSSIRLEMLREGIQNYEKIKILNDATVNDYVARFTVATARNAEYIVTKAESLLKEASVK